MSFISRATAVAVATGLATTSVQALDFGNGFTLTGDVELEYVSPDGGDDSTFGFTDLTLGWRSQGGGAVGVGFDLSLVSFHDLDSEFDESVFWGGLVLTTAYGDVTIGSPRPLLDQLPKTPDIGAARVLDLELGFLSGSTLAYFKLLDSDIDVYGISFKGASGAFNYGAAVHQADQGGDNADVIELVVGYTLDQVELYAAFENLDSGATDFQKFIVGGRYSADRWSVGAEATDFDVSGSSVSTFKLFADYNVTEALAIGAQALEISDGGNQRVYGLTGEYGFGSGGFAELGYFDVDGSGDAVTASIGYRF
jgi:hypothetical protein